MLTRVFLVAAILRWLAFGRRVLTLLRTLDVEGVAELAEDALVAGAVPRARVPFRELPLAVAGARIMLGQLETMLTHEAGTRAGDDPEELHKMRVATRRLRVAARVFGRHLERAGGGVVPVDDVKTVADALGRVRDLDVAAEVLRERIREATPADAPALERLIADRLRAREAARAALLGILDGAAMAHLRGPFRAVLQVQGADAAIHAAPGRARRRSVRRCAPRLMARSLRALHASAADLHAPTIEELHQVRIKAKRFRYTCEFFKPAYGAALDETIRATTDVQDALGTLHDADVSETVLLADIERLAQDGERAADAGALARLITHYREQRLAATLQFRERWPELPRPKRFLKELPSAVGTKGGD
jgi:CHAD domain-containing protein